MKTYYLKFKEDNAEDIYLCEEPFKEGAESESYFFQYGFEYIEIKVIDVWYTDTITNNPMNTKWLFNSLLDKFGNQNNYFGRCKIYLLANLYEKQLFNIDTIESLNNANIKSYLLNKINNDNVNIPEFIIGYSNMRFLNIKDYFTYDLVKYITEMCIKTIEDIDKLDYYKQANYCYIFHLIFNPKTKYFSDFMNWNSWDLTERQIKSRIKKMPLMLEDECSLIDIAINNLQKMYKKNKVCIL